MAEWLKAPVLKIGVVSATVGSNPTSPGSCCVCFWRLLLVGVSFNWQDCGLQNRQCGFESYFPRFPLVSVVCVVWFETPVDTVTASKGIETTVCFLVAVGYSLDGRV